MSSRYKKNKSVPLSQYFTQTCYTFSGLLTLVKFLIMSVYCMCNKTISLWDQKSIRPVNSRESGMKCAISHVHHLIMLQPWQHSKFITNNTQIKYFEPWILLHWFWPCFYNSRAPLEGVSYHALGFYYWFMSLTVNFKFTELQVV